MLIERPEHLTQTGIGLHYAVGVGKGKLPVGITYGRPVSSLDILPTALALAGAPSIAAQRLDGVNLLPFLKGERTGEPHEFLFWRMKARSIWAVRSGSEKLVMQKTEAPRLHDLASDIGETSDLAEKNTQRRAALQQAWDGWNSTLPEPLWAHTSGWSPTSHSPP